MDKSKLLVIRHLPVKLSLDEFIHRQEMLVFEMFHDKPAQEDMRPFCNILLRDGSAMLIFPDFGTVETKTASMEQIKLLASMSGATAYIGVSEAYFKAIDTKKTGLKSALRFVEDLGGRVSLLPGRQEILMMNMEYKKEGKLFNKLIRWLIDRSGIVPKLTDRQEIAADKMEGRMTNIIR